MQRGTRWSGRTVAVTRAGGFIGSHLVVALAEHGDDPRALVDDRVDGSAGLLDELDPAHRSALDVRSGDSRDADWVRRSLDVAAAVFHLGALVGIPHRDRSPRDVVASDVNGTLHGLEGAREHYCERAVHISTSEVYGSGRQSPMDERHPSSARSPDAATTTTGWASERRRTTSEPNGRWPTCSRRS